MICFASEQAQQVIEHIRDVLARRGVTGIAEVGRTFRIFDSDNSRTLDAVEFFTNLRDYGVNLSQKVGPLSVPVTLPDLTCFSWWLLEFCKSSSSTVSLLVGNLSLPLREFSCRNSRQS